MMHVSRYVTRLKRHRIYTLSLGMILKLQLFGKAKIRGDALNDDDFFSKNIVQAIVNVIYTMNFLVIGSAAYSDHVEHFSIRKNYCKTYGNYKNRFVAAPNKHNAHGDSVSICKTLAA